MKKRTVTNLAELIDAIAAGPEDPTSSDLIAIDITLWDGRHIIGSYEPDFTPNITSDFDFIADDEALRPLVEKLLAEGNPFVTQTGESDSVCTLFWEIKSE